MREPSRLWCGPLARCWSRWRQGAGPVTAGASALLLTLLVFGSGPATAAGRPGLEYNRDVRPILAENCFACHGPDSASSQGRPAAGPSRRSRSRPVPSRPAIPRPAS